MTLYTKPAVRSSWGQTALGSDLQDPGNTFASAGWQLGAKPPRQYFNWVLNYVFNAVRYFCQAGIPDWDANESYSQGAIVKSGQALWQLIATSSIGQVPQQGGTWSTPLVPTPIAGDNGQRTANTSWVSTYFLPVGAPIQALNGVVSNAQIPVGSVTQWQGSLSIAGSQVSSAVARANTLQLVGGSYATFNWAGIGGQPSYLLGSNDGANVFAYNPSNFSVANSQALQGLLPSGAASGNTIVQRDPNGYIYGQYLNQASPNNESSTISQVITTQGADGFLRKTGFASFAAQLINQNAIMVLANFVSSLGSNGFYKFPGGFIFQWGSVFTSGNNPTQVSIAFPTAFASQFFGGGCSTLRATGGAQGSGYVTTSSRTGATYVFDNVASPANTVGGYWWAWGV